MTQNNTDSQCSAMCPKCGADLYFSNLTCICKTPGCDYHCEKCRDELNDDIRDAAPIQSAN